MALRPRLPGLRLLVNKESGHAKTEMLGEIWVSVAKSKTGLGRVLRDMLLRLLCSLHLSRGV